MYEAGRLHDLFCLQCSPFGNHNTSSNPQSNLVVGEEFKAMCQKHGDTTFIVESTGYKRCKRCRNEAVVESRRNRKRKLVQQFGGKCELCGYDKCVDALQFHHLDPENKEFGVSRGICKSWDAALSEAEKCILLCANCHAEVGCGMTQIPRYANGKRRHC